MSVIMQKKIVTQCVFENTKNPFKKSHPLQFKQQEPYVI